MKKIISFALILTALVFTTSAFGQTHADSSKTSRYIYCELTVSAKAFVPSLDIKTDFGVAKEGESSIMKDPKTGKQREFTSMIDALNYMSENGWDLVAAYTNIYATIYVLRKIRYSE